MVAKYFESHEIPSPSFNKDYVEPKDLPTEIMVAKQVIVKATEELNVLALSPTAFLTATNTTILPALHFIYRHDIATKFHIDEEITFADIACKIAMDVSDTERILRMAMTQRIFSEPRPGVVAHTAISRAIATTPLLSSYLGLLTEEIWLGSFRVVDAMAKWPGSNEPDETGYNLASGITDAYFEGLKRNLRIPYGRNASMKSWILRIMAVHLNELGWSSITIGNPLTMAQSWNRSRTPIRIFSAGSSMTGPTNIAFRYCEILFQHSRMVLGYSLVSSVSRNLERRHQRWLKDA
ncbi:6-hydroxytryprostatin B O-methyltransferase protein [Rutstroemia sp. NJR-2017a BBW]|nr:6-hydroxytryprostatin B O-methyltransferase protein [Rutstroemia sp. NJR-2017a BBW]